MLRASLFTSSFLFDKRRPFVRILDPIQNPAICNPTSFPPFEIQTSPDFRSRLYCIVQYSNGSQFICSEFGSRIVRWCWRLERVVHKTGHVRISYGVQILNGIWNPDIFVRFLNVVPLPFENWTLKWVVFVWFRFSDVTAIQKPDPKMSGLWMIPDFEGSDFGSPCTYFFGRCWIWH